MRSPRPPFRPVGPALVLLAAALGAQEPAGEARPAAGTRLDDANREAAERVTRTSEREGAALTNRLRGLAADEVLVVGGLFDSVQEILAAWRCPHTVIRPDELEHRLTPPFARKVVLLNCHLLDREFPARHPPAPDPSPEDARAALERVIEEAGLDGPNAPGKALRERGLEVARFAGRDYSEAGLERLGAAVLAGAWVWSSDWTVLALGKALRGRIRWTGRSTFEETVPVRPAAGARRHPLLEGVFDGKAEPRWWLETESYLFAVRGPHVRLVESRTLAARYRGNRDVVVLLEPGDGRVLHALGHGWLQRGDVDDVAPMQRLLLNFLVGKSLANWRADHPEAR